MQFSSKWLLWTPYIFISSYLIKPKLYDWIRSKVFNTESVVLSWEDHLSCFNQNGSFGYFTLFILEKPLPHSADEAGIVSIRSIRSRKYGASFHKALLTWFHCSCILPSCEQNLSYTWLWRRSHFICSMSQSTPAFFKASSKCWGSYFTYESPKSSSGSVGHMPELTIGIAFITPLCQSSNLFAIDSCNFSGTDWQVAWEFSLPCCTTCMLSITGKSVKLNFELLCIFVDLHLQIEAVYEYQQLYYSIPERTWGLSWVLIECQAYDAL